MADGEQVNDLRLQLVRVLILVHQNELETALVVFAHLVVVVQQLEPERQQVIEIHGVGGPFASGVADDLVGHTRNHRQQGDSQSKTHPEQVVKEVAEVICRGCRCAQRDRHVYDDRDQQHRHQEAGAAAGMEGNKLLCFAFGQRIGASQGAIEKRIGGLAGRATDRNVSQPLGDDYTVSAGQVVKARGYQDCLSGLEFRDRIVKLAEDPAQLIVNFSALIAISRVGM